MDSRARDEPIKELGDLEVSISTFPTLLREGDYYALLYYIRFRFL